VIDFDDPLMAHLGEEEEIVVRSSNVFDGHTFLVLKTVQVVSSNISSIMKIMKIKGV